MDNGNQMVTIIAIYPARNDGRSSAYWTEVEAELDALVRRMGFTMVLQAQGAIGNQGAYQVTGERVKPLGDDGHAAVRRELADLLFVYSGTTASLGFGAIESV